MPQLFQQKWPWLDGVHAMRAGLLDYLTNPELAYTPGGQNSPLGVLFRQVGQVEQAYTRSLQTFHLDFTYPPTDPALETSLAALQAWYQTLDAEFQTVLLAFPDEDLQKTIQRPNGYAWRNVSRV